MARPFFPPLTSCDTGDSAAILGKLKRELSLDFSWHFHLVFFFKDNPQHFVTPIFLQLSMESVPPLITLPHFRTRGWAGGKGRKSWVTSATTPTLSVSLPLSKYNGQHKTDRAQDGLCGRHLTVSVTALPVPLRGLRVVETPAPSAAPNVSLFVTVRFHRSLW